MSRAHRWPGDDTPLTGVHGGTKKAALRAIAEARYQHARVVAREIVARCGSGAIVATFIRKDRLRPKAQASPELPLPEPKAPTKSRWHCRPSGQRHVWGRRGEGRPMRTKDQCDAQRAALRVAQEWRCGLCGEKLADDEPFGGSLDHVIPFALGGKDRLGNLLLCHGECNGAKTNDSPTGCEMVFLLAVNARLHVEPRVF